MEKKMASLSSTGSFAAAFPYTRELAEIRAFRHSSCPLPRVELKKSYVKIARLHSVQSQQQVCNTPFDEMKKALLIFLLLTLPWQAFAAAERTFAHALGSGSEGAPTLVLKHFVEHAQYLLHHHDDDGGDAHEDDSQESVQHLLDYDQHSGLNAVIPASVQLPMFIVAPRPPAIAEDPIPNWIPHPLFRPPRLPA